MMTCDILTSQKITKFTLNLLPQYTMFLLPISLPHRRKAIAHIYSVQLSRMCHLTDMVRGPGMG